MSAIKNFPKFLVDNGLVFEINRKVLHPLGLAMIVDVDPKNRRQLAITNLVETEDEVGFVYESEAFSCSSEKFNKFLEKKQAALDARKAKFGFVEQDKEDV